MITYESQLKLLVDNANAIRRQLIKARKYNAELVPQISRDGSQLPIGDPLETKILLHSYYAAIERIKNFKKTKVLNGIKYTNEEKGE